MPSRHISPQSFDELLNELGDDPAIPDPHGIRKSSSPKVQSKAPFQIQLPASLELKRIGILVGLGVGFICLGFYLFSFYKPISNDPSAAFQEAQKEIADLKNELTNLREDVLDIEDNLYESMDLIEVSIHSLKQNKALGNSKPKSLPTPFEVELRDWRYLGLSQTRSTQHAFFHNGKATVMLEKGSIALGEWKLTHLEKELATFTHSQGKTLTLKPSRPE